MIRKMVIVFLVLAFTFPVLKTKEAQAFDCLLLTPNSSAAQKRICQNELSDIEAQLADLIKRQEAQKKQSGTLKGDIDYLNAQIVALKAKVKARSLAIAQLKVSINEKVSKISSLSQKINKEHESLAQLLRNTNEFDNENIIHLVLSDDTVSDFYSDLESYDAIKKAVKNSVEQITGMKIETEVEKKNLEKKKDAETDAKAQLETAQSQMSQSEKEKQQLLSVSKKKESDYQKLAAEKRARADKIRTALFALAGLSQGIPFGTALDYAKDVSAKTGIDPAFLLAILTQETNLGKNVGSCYVTDMATGNGKGANTGSTQLRVMHPTRDIPVFLNILEKLNLSYLTTRVSCWQPAYTKSGAPSGWGGAMGPAQFIPSTWKLFENRLKTILGHDANPWMPKDAFLASGLFLTDLGAVGDSASAQSRAACKYYGTGGASCNYSKSVMKLKAKIQADINLLSD